MPDDIFPHPHEDSSAEDPFIGPMDEDLDQSVGASPVNPLSQAQAPKRRLALFAIGLAITAIVALFMFSGGDDPVETDPMASSGQVDEPVTGEVPETPTAQSIEQATRPVPRSRNNQQTIDPGNLVNAVPSGEDTSSPNTYPQQPTYPDPTQAPPLNQYPSTANSAAAGQPYSPPQGAGYGQPMPDDEYERQSRLIQDRERAEILRAEEEARLEAVRAEEDRLRGSPTLIANGLSTETGGGAAPAGSSRFSVGSATGGAASVGGGGASAFDDSNLIPGTRVSASLMSEFISDVQGGGLVEAQLAEPLRSDGETILPAGTRAYGEGSASPPSPGREARVTMTFNVFVTPDGQVIRNMQGRAADPETYAMSIAGNVDNRYVERVARGVLSTAVDLALTSQAEDRRSAFEMSSPRDEAINDARRRAASIINGPIGDENSNRAAVTLEPGTAFTIIFGF